MPPEKFTFKFSPLEVDSFMKMQEAFGAITVELKKMGKIKFRLSEPDPESNVWD